MATFYIQLENKLLQISGELTDENISKALGYVPVSPNVTNELSQRVDNITFDSLKDNPFLQDGSGELNIVDEAGNIIAKIDVDGIHSVDFIADGHTLSQKADKSELSNYATKDEVSDLVDMSVVTELQGKVNKLIDTDADKSVRDIAVDVLTETLVSETATEAYDTLAEMSAWIKSHPEDAAAMNTAIQKNATDITNLDAAYKAADAKVLTDAQEYTDNINFYTIKDNPIVDGEAGSITFVDETGYIGLKVTEDGIIAKDVVTPEHTLSSKADKSELPTKLSDLTNDSGFITINDIPVLEEYVTETELNDKGFLTEHQDISHLASKEWVNSNNYATEEDISSIEFNSLQNNPIVEDSNGEFNLVDDLGNVGFKVNQEGLFVKDVIAGEHMLSNKADKTYIDDLGVTELNAILVDTDAEADDPIIPDYITENELETALSGKMDKVTLSKVATSGSYNDLSNKPTIPSAVTESTVSSWGFTKNTGTYSKPSTGIPKSDLASAVQTSLGKADTALQSYTEQYKGTITGVSANGTSVATSGVANIPAASTSAYGVTKLSSATNSTSITLAATASAVKAAYDLANGKQDKLVSGTNIKTINGSSILGSGDITISGGGSSSGSGAYPEIDGSIYKDDTLLGNWYIVDESMPLMPNTFYVFPECGRLDIIAFGPETSGVANEYLFQFTSGNEATTLSLPGDLKWTEELTIEPNMIYQVSILKGMASVLSWSNSIELKDNFIDIQRNELVFQYPTTSELSINVYGRTTGMPSNHEIVVPSGSSSYVASNLSTIMYINSVSPSSDSTYNYTFQIS